MIEMGFHRAAAAYSAGLLPPGFARAPEAPGATDAFRSMNLATREVPKERAADGPANLLCSGNSWYDARNCSSSGDCNVGTHECESDQANESRRLRRRNGQSRLRLAVSGRSNLAAPRTRRLARHGA